MSKEKAELAEKDKIVLEELAGWMRDYVWEVKSCGRNGDIAMAKIKQLAPQGLKILVNYI